MTRCDECETELTENASTCPGCGKTLAVEVGLSPPFPEELRFVISPNPPSHAQGGAVRLQIVQGGTPGREFPIQRDLVEIGRWDPECDSHPDIDLSDDDTEAKISRKHAKIVKKGDQWYLVDCGSRNGTFVAGGRRLGEGESYPLTAGEQIVMGKIAFRFVTPS